MTVTYLGARVPQLVKNFRRGTAEGLSPFMFILLVLGSVTYALSIFIRSAHHRFLDPKETEHSVKAVMYNHITQAIRKCGMIIAKLSLLRQDIVKHKFCCCSRKWHGINTRPIFPCFCLACKNLKSAPQLLAAKLVAVMFMSALTSNYLEQAGAA